jgi:pyruvate,orthophosphate dikinase
MNHIHVFSEEFCPDDPNILQKSGLRGRRVFELAHLKLPVVPGFVIDSDTCKKLEEIDLPALIREGLTHIEKLMGKKLGDVKDALYIKILGSSNLHIAGQNPSIHNVGLNEETMAYLSSRGGEKFAHTENLYLLMTYATKLCDVDGKPFMDLIKSGELPTKEKLKELEELIPEGKRPVQDVFEQTVSIVRMMIEKYADIDDPEDEFSILIQAMVYGHLTPDSYAGHCFTRNYIDGTPGIVGGYANNSFDPAEGEGEDINKLDDQTKAKLSEIAEKLEDHFKELRIFKFTRGVGKLWIVDQNAVDKKSTQATVKTLLALYNKKKLESHEVVKAITPGELNELLHPVIDAKSAKKVPHVTGGLTGSTGAASGRVFFSTEKLMQVHREATLKGEDSDVILCLPSSYAEDVKGIEVAQGVITAEGGYSSHAPVVARSLGKISLVNGDLEIKKDAEGTPSFTIGEYVVKEGDYISLDVPFYKPPEIYFGRVNLIKPDVEKNGLIEFLKIVDEHVDHSQFSIRANADLGRDASLARMFGARGIGLCRTEHMFFAEERINLFRRMILAKSEDERRKILSQLEPFQTSDFYDLFKVMHPYGVTIRLLDAPLHEFLPRTSEMFDAYCQYLDEKKLPYNKSDLSDRIERLGEVNPMLGHRGCRVAISYPEIYEMQIRAIFKACIRLQNEDMEIAPEIMIPIIMNEAELQFIRNGKKIEGKSIPGIRHIAEKVFEEHSSKPVQYRVGTMVELPAAAINSDTLAKYADFFSFGTNDLTQTTFGLSRDDANSFFPVYTEYDLLRANPFQVLAGPVKEMIEISASRGRLTRPDLKLGLCGEHGADPKNIDFCKDTGLNYVSCSPYSIPLALLAISQINIKEKMSK